MSYELQDRALAARVGRGPAPKLVLIALARHANDDGESCFPSVGRLAEITELSERAVQASLRKLEAAGLVCRQDDARGGRGRTVSYRILLPRKGESAAPFGGKGESAAPFHGAEKGAARSRKGAVSAERVQEFPKKGAIAAPDSISYSISRSNQEAISGSGRKARPSPRAVFISTGRTERGAEPPREQKPAAEPSASPDDFRLALRRMAAEKQIPGQPLSEREELARRNGQLDALDVRLSKADWQRAYRQSPEGRAAVRRYANSESGREAQRRYAQSEKGRTAQARYHQRLRLAAESTEISAEVARGAK